MKNSGLNALLSAFVLLGLSAGLGACAPAIESKTVPEAVPDFDSQQKALQDGLKQENAVLTLLTSTSIEKIQAWKKMPLKNCSLESLNGLDPLSTRQSGTTHSYQWDARVLFDRTNGTMIFATADYYYLIEPKAGGLVETEAFENAKSIAQFTERKINGGVAQLELWQGTSNCFLTVDGSIAYQTALLPQILVTTLSNLNPVILSQIGTGKIEEGILPHKTRVQMQRDLFPFRSSLGMKVDTRIPISFFRGEWAPRRPGVSNTIEVPKQFLNSLHTKGFENFPNLRNSVQWQDPTLTETGLRIAGTDLQSLSLGDQGRLVLPVATDPFQAPVVRLEYSFKSPSFGFAFYSNPGRRLLVRYTMDFEVETRTGTEVSGTLKAVSGRLESLTPRTQTQCLNEMLQLKPYESSNDLTLSQILQSCRPADLHSQLALFQPDFIDLLMTTFKDPKNLAPRVTESLVNEVTRGLLNTFGSEPLPDWWKAQSDWRFKESAKANVYLMAQAAKYPVIQAYLPLVVDRAELYSQIFSTRAFQSRNLDQLLFVVVRLNKAGLPMGQVLMKYRAPLWSGLAEREIELFIEGVQNLRPEEQIRALDNPQAVVSRVLAEKKEIERKSQVQKRIAEFNLVVEQLSPVLKQAARDQSVSRSYSGFADRVSLNQIRAPHQDRVQRAIQLLKALVAPETRMDPVAKDVMTDLRRLLEQDLATEDFRFLEAILMQSAPIVSQYVELTQIFRDWSLSMNRERTLQMAASVKSVEMVRHLTALRLELMNKTGLSSAELLTVSVFIAEKVALKPDAGLRAITDMMFWVGAELQNGGNFLRNIERNLGTAGTQFLLEKSTDLENLTLQIKALYQDAINERPYLAAARLQTALGTVSDWEQFAGQLENLLAVMALNQKTCAVVTKCQASLHDLLRLGLSSRASSVRIDITTFNSALSIAPFLGTGFQEAHQVNPAELNASQALSLIHSLPLQTYEESLNHFLARLSDPAVTQYLVGLQGHLGNLPSGDRARMIRTNLELAVITPTSVLWSATSELEVSAAKVSEVLAQIAKTTRKERLTQLEKELKSALGI